MLSIELSRFTVVACFAGPQALDALPVQPEAHRCRVAPDELLLVAATPELAGVTERRAIEHFAGAGNDALVVDQSDGWCVFTLRGDEAENVFAALDGAASRAPPGVPAGRGRRREREDHGLRRIHRVVRAFDTSAPRRLPPPGRVPRPD